MSEVYRIEIIRCKHCGKVEHVKSFTTGLEDICFCPLNDKAEAEVALPKPAHIVPRSKGSKRKKA